MDNLRNRRIWSDRIREGFENGFDEEDRAIVACLRQSTCSLGRVDVVYECESGESKFDYKLVERERRCYTSEMMSVSAG